MTLNNNIDFNESIMILYLVIVGLMAVAFIVPSVFYFFSSVAYKPSLIAQVLIGTVQLVILLLFWTIGG